ncbi:hypothetical protein SAMN05216269_103142 [Flavobacterium xinjiangense]|uniref:Uncharacterized protein n=1 Tax=Flavobacterium xinjiangense TaxID=178356 RepID=A0A1M7H370_9FLAO|nr:hypothetical protein SAMN05216269_103142 [Flavobacterium xinjiangense]
MEMQRWRFFQKPVGLELYFLKPELTFTFFFLFFFEDGRSCFPFFGGVLMETAIKHPQAPQKIIIVAIAEIIIFRGAQWRCCGNRTATIDARVERRYGAKRSGYERETAGGKLKSSAFSAEYLDLGRSDVFHGTEPTPMAGRRSNR